MEQRYVIDDSVKREYVAARDVRTFLPFLLDKVAGDPSLNQADGIHPNIEGSKIVADTVWNVLKPMVDAAAAS